MIYHLNGTLTRKEPGLAVVECHGVGYGCRISSQTYDRLPAAGEAVTMLTYLAVSENDQSLFGFATERERLVFRKLLNVSQIGPAKALGVLSSAPIDDLLAAIEMQDYKRLQAYKGLGPKLAQRLVLELRDKVADLSGIDVKSSGRADFLPAGVDRTAQAMANVPENLRDAVQAIEALFNVNTDDALQYVRQAQKKNPAAASTPDLVKAATMVARGG